MNLANQLHGAGVPVFPCRANKKPAVNKGDSWKDYAVRSPQQNQWPSGVVGVPVPDGVVVIDLDTYKGVTREAVEQHLGCSVPWAAAFIQTTGRGGQHYAFRAPDWPVKQGDSIGVKGLDTRAGGKGFICTGAGYTPNGLGVFALAYPDTLPPLPDGCRGVLEHVKRTAPDTAPDRPAELDIDKVREALTYLDPGCSRSDWVKRGMELRSGFGDDEHGGFALYDLWSSGGLWGGDSPGNYDGDTIYDQWTTFKADRGEEGDRHIGSLFYDAMKAGWRPPAGFDTSAAFGVDAAPADTYRHLLTRIDESGTDSAAVGDIITEIRAAGCNALQVDLLRAELLAALKSAGLLDKTLRERINGMVATYEAPRAVTLPVGLVSPLPNKQLSRPTGVHGTNALAALDEIFGDDLCMLGGELRWWGGSAWRPVTDEDLERALWVALMPDQSKKPNVIGTRDAVKRLAPSADVPPRERRVFFANGVLDVTTGELTPHQRENRNTGTLAASFNPQAGCPLWFSFIRSLFGGEADEMARVSLLQEVIGWSMIQDDLNAQKAIAFDGTTRGGKGVIFEILRTILGPDVCGTTSFCNLDDGKTQSAFRQYDIMLDFEAKAPARQAMKAATGFMNKLVANELVSIQLLNTQAPWQGRLNSKMLIACNGVPTMLDDSGASTSRFHVLRFTTSFLGREDRGLAARLKGEVDGVALWALEGLRRLISNGAQFTQPETSTEAIDALKECNQPLKEFITEYLVFGPETRCHVKDVWALYRLYAQDANVRLPQRAQFVRSLTQTVLGTAAYKRSVRLDGAVSTGYEGMGINPAGNPFATQPLKGVG